jgi:TPR repeat protein
MRMLLPLLFMLSAPFLRADNLALELAAKAGSSWAQYKLGSCYYAADEGYPINYEKAAYWYEKAAENGHDKAQLAIGIAYRRGQGVSRDIPLGLSWMRKAAAQGHGLAMYNIAVVYDEVYRDYEQAYAWALVGRDNGQDEQHRQFCKYKLEELDKKVSRSMAASARARAKSIASALGLK